MCASIGRESLLHYSQHSPRVKAALTRGPSFQEDGFGDRFREHLMASGGSKKFRDLAASEASAAINQALSTRLTKSVGDLQAFRHSLDEAARAFEKALGAATDHQSTVADLVEKMAAAAAADAQEQVQRVKTEADSIIAAAKSELGKAVEAANEARGQAARARDAHAKAEVARKEVDAALHKEIKEKESAIG